MSRKKKGFKPIPTPISHLFYGSRFVVPWGQWSGAVVFVLSVTRSVRKEGVWLFGVKSRKGARGILVFSPDTIVDAAPPRSWPEPEGPKCSCRNHRGGEKVKYRSQAEAVQAILDRHLRYGGHKVRKCRTEDGVFHVVSIKKKGAK